MDEQYTATGLALNAAAVTSWAAVHEVLFGRVADKGDVAGAVLVYGVGAWTGVRQPVSTRIRPHQELNRAGYRVRVKSVAVSSLPT